MTAAIVSLADYRRTHPREPVAAWIDTVAEQYVVAVNVLALAWYLGWLRIWGGRC